MQFRSLSGLILAINVLGSTAAVLKREGPACASPSPTPNVLVADDDNKVQNSGFEAGLDKWTVKKSSSGGSVVVVSDSLQASGCKAAKISFAANSKTDTNPFVSISQPMSAVPGNSILSLELLIGRPKDTPESAVSPKVEISIANWKFPAFVACGEKGNSCSNVPAGHAEYNRYKFTIPPGAAITGTQKGIADLKIVFTYPSALTKNAPVLIDNVRYGVFRDFTTLNF
ncbi:WSC domain-containing protein [Colletotrichum truncatum]|uniref:WSC domain-containing protein n=1 Tax=Colletotrichum truncatum TaxID=5467 RepID=A0ACC3YPX5_COLTU|nr:WSC domain-containing protein [Colletotrichum truncatum]KAF6796833.1 WSC domain-containing protein [Colletotrichum truncatum]